MNWITCGACPSRSFAASPLPSRRWNGGPTPPWPRPRPSGGGGDVSALPKGDPGPRRGSTFTVADLRLAAYLKASGLRLLRPIPRPRGVVLFVFDDRARIADALIAESAQRRAAGRFAPPFSMRRYAEARRDLAAIALRLRTTGAPQATPEDVSGGPAE